MRYNPIIYGLFVFAFLFCVGSVVSAQTSPTENRTSLSPVAQSRITNLTANISNRFDAHARRLTNVTTRLESRIGKLALEGKEVTEAITALSEAKSALNDATTKLATIDRDVAVFVGSENPRVRWESLKVTYREIYADLKRSHEATIRCILLLQGAPTVDTTASSTATTTDITNE